MHDKPLSQPHLERSPWWVWASLAVGLAASLVLGFFSEGGYHDDGLTHYLFASWAWNDAAYLVDEWGRPGLTCLLFPFARLGWWACRLESAVLSAVTAWLAYDTARRLGLRWASRVPLLCWIQPLFLMASYTTLTETAAAFYLMLAVRCLVAGRPNVSAIAFSLCLVTRYELWALAPIWALAFWRYRSRWTAYGLLFWAPLVHNLAGYLLMDRWPIWFMVGAAHPDHYGAGTVLSMTLKSMAASGPAVAVCALAAVTVAWRRPMGWTIPAVYLLHLMTQSVIFNYGAFASGGYPRFLVTAAPLAAICTAAVVESIAVRRRVLLGVFLAALLMAIALEQEADIAGETWIFLIDKARPIVWSLAGLTTLALLWMALRPDTKTPARLLGLVALVGSVLPLAYLVRPHGLSADAIASQAAVQWLAVSPYAQAPVITANIWACHYLDRGRNLMPPESTDFLADAAPGTVFLWDANHAVHPRFGLSAEVMTNRPAWRQLWQSDQRLDGQPAARVYLRE